MRGNGMNEGLLLKLKIERMVPGAPHGSGQGLGIQPAIVTAPHLNIPWKIPDEFVHHSTAWINV